MDHDMFDKEMRKITDAFVMNREGILTPNELLEVINNVRKTYDLKPLDLKEVVGYEA